MVGAVRSVILPASLQPSPDCRSSSGVDIVGQDACTPRPALPAAVISRRHTLEFLEGGVEGTAAAANALGDLLDAQGFVRQERLRCLHIAPL